MLVKFSFLGKIKIPKSFGGFLILLSAFLVFFLDIVTREKIPFHIFYFPSIMLMTWNFGKGAGRFMACLTALMWFLAEWDTDHFESASIFWQNGIIYLLTFIVILKMTEIIHEKVVELDIKSKELARSNLELEQFAAKAAHDLQSPLASILGFTELLKEKYEKTGDAETQEFTDHIIQSVKRGSTFIKALLNYSNVRKPEAPPSPVELGKIVKIVIEDFHFAKLEKKAEITCDPLPTLAINAGLVGLLFQNLIGNAMKYCEKEPRIHISAVRQGKEWLFSIKDNGIGIPEESRERIFVMFEKLPTQRKYPGSGIGLATCQKIVERYGGRIWVESKPGEGSTFFFTLPAG